MAPHHQDLYSSDLETSKQLLELGSSTERHDGNADGTPVLERVLATSLTEKLAEARPRWAHALEELCSNQEPPISTVRDLLLHPSPPVGVLIILKNAAKASRKDPQGPVPPRPATALYLAAIGMAWLRCGELITTLDIDDLDEKMPWAAGQTWGDPEVAEAIETVADQIGAAGCRGDR